MMAKKRSIKESNNNVAETTPFTAVVIGTSAGGLTALNQIFKHIEKSFKLPIIVVQHLSPESDNFLAKNLNSNCVLSVSEASEKEEIEAGHIYIAPANYHLLIEDDHTFSLNIDPKVNYCRPSIDVLFESAANVYKDRLIGIVLTGANSDGARGLKYIKELGGTTLVQDPKTAEVAAMPKSAVNLFPADFVLPLEKIYPKLKFLNEST